MGHKKRGGLHTSEGFDLMCLYVVFKPSPTEEMVFYKIVGAEDRLGPWFPKASKHYTPGAVVRADPVLGDIIQPVKECDKSGESEFAVYGGAIHVYSSPVSAGMDVRVRLWHRAQQFKVIKVKCKPEHFVAWGFFNEAAYTEVEVLD